MDETYQGFVRGVSWMEVVFPFGMKRFYLKCRVSKHVMPHALLGEFEEVGLRKLQFGAKLKPA